MKEKTYLVCWAIGIIYFGISTILWYLSEGIINIELCLWIGSTILIGLLLFTPKATEERKRKMNLKIKTINQISGWLLDYGIPQKFIDELEPDDLHSIWQLALHGSRKEE